MGSKQATSAISPPELADCLLQRIDRTPENDLENRAKSLREFLQRLAHDRLPSSGQPHVLDQLSDLKVKVQATYNMLQIAKLLREPARQSMLSTVRESLDGLERVIANCFDVEMTPRHS